MKKNKNELLRLQSIIESDRINTGDDFLELIVSDAEKLLKDFFDFSSSPTLTIERDGDNYRVELMLKATRIKNFTSLPKQQILFNDFAIDYA